MTMMALLRFSFPMPDGEMKVLFCDTGVS